MHGLSIVVDPISTITTSAMVSSPSMRMTQLCTQSTLLLLVLILAAVAILPSSSTAAELELSDELELPVTCTSGADCSGNGVCKNGTCMCIQPYTGPTCSRLTCPNQCSGTGTCDSRTGKCTCYTATDLATIYPTDGPEHEWGFEGADCSLKTCFTDCGVADGKGKCNKQTGLCECTKGYWGPEGMHCNSILCNDTCSNHGFCVDSKCICDVAVNKLSGWTGEHCEKPVCPNHCFESAGLGTCVNAQCQCEPDWYGEDCSLKKCPMNYSPLAWIGASKVMCSGHGDCKDGVCKCADGFTGADCSQRQCPGLTIHGQESNVSCSGHGTCQPNGACICDAGFTGEDCFDRVCTSTCGLAQKRGSCDGETGVCVCNEGFFGADCSFKRCDDSCNGNGECLDEACVCHPGFQGVHCEIPVCGNNCSYAEGQGQCINKQCVCNPGFNGVECLYKDCPLAVNPAANNSVALTCAGNGVCTAGQCVCNAAWTGPTCTTRACPYNCSNVGTCSKDGICSCPAGGLDGRGGYLGKFCEQPICPNNCGEALAQGSCVKGQCVCKPGYGMPDCMYKTCPVGLPPLSSIVSTPVACSGTGSCIKGACVCQPGYTGANCGQRPCLNGCTNSTQGTCQANGVCKCADRFTGPDCSKLACPLGCSNHGTCLGNGQCKCDSRWTGAQCEIERCPNGCSGAGECVLKPATATTLAREVCECDPGFQGADCSQPICLPLTDDGKMCKGKGRCVIVDMVRGPATGVHTCRCDPPYIGAQCGNTLCNNTCSYHGVCTGQPGDNRCECDDGWYGPDCDRTGECEPADCFGRGKCAAGLKNEPTCQCAAPFGGPDCSLCVHNCTGHGTCTPNGCVCQDGWLGPLCDRREDCDPKDCGGKGHGTCITDANGQPTCKCQFPWSDFDCMQCQLDCNDHGECNAEGTCTCEKGWKGSRCDRYGDCPNGCSDRGTCMGDSIGDPVCICQAGYGGVDCGSIICNKTCPAHSTCLDQECQCLPGWTGDDCTERDDCPNNCLGLGTCMADLQGKPFCKCQLGRTGPSCEFQSCTQTCSDHGSCYIQDNVQKCACEPGYGGPNCEVLDCGIWADCGGSTHGECALNTKNKPQCLCSSPYTGTNCTDILCTKTTCVHGTCSNEKCACEPGWKGAGCDYRVPCPAPGCGEEGRCISDGNGVGKCECNPGFTGPNCLDVTCDLNCSGHGKCVNDGCECDSGFHGDQCQITAPCPSNCNNHGECNFDTVAQQSICDCEDMYDSPDGVGDCSIQRGKTWIDSNGKLQYQCLPPYHGNLCQLKGCAQKCQNGGTCAADGICDCQPGFKGVDCSEMVCPNGCSNGGECDLEAKMCRCFYGYSGADCSIYNSAVCQSTCSFKCSANGGNGGLIQVSDKDGLLSWVSARECHRMCKLGTMCEFMFGSGHTTKPNGQYVTITQQ